MTRFEVERFCVDKDNWFQNITNNSIIMKFLIDIYSKINSTLFRQI